MAVGFYRPYLKTSSPSSIPVHFLWVPGWAVGGLDWGVGEGRLWDGGWVCSEEELSSGRGSSVEDGAEPVWADISDIFAVSNHPRLAAAKHWA